MRSSVVVTSWWSNCLALTCLERLSAHAPGRELFVMQAGKSDSQMDKFRAFLPERVTELPYPEHIDADDSAMREYLARVALHGQEGVWFLDHDTFLLEPSEVWFESADVLFEDSCVCLCSRRPIPGCGITQPAYWLSPARLPGSISSFSPVPLVARPYARRPDMSRHNGDVVPPGKDTLVGVQEELAAMGMAATFAAGKDSDPRHFLQTFPRHMHIGGIHLYTGPTVPPAGMSREFMEWRKHTACSFESFFRNCPQDWLAIEEPELLRRHAEILASIEVKP